MRPRSKLAIHAPRGTTKIDAISIQEALSLATYVEQMLMSEQQWMMNRLSWLFVSQSFCFTAFILAANAEDPPPHVIVITVVLPVFAIVSALAVFVAVQAAMAVSHKLGDQRAALAKHLNSDLRVRNSQISLPQIGARFRDGDLRWTLLAGALPQWLPLVLVLAWFVLLGLSWEAWGVILKLLPTAR